MRRCLETAKREISPVVREGKWRNRSGAQTRVIGRPPTPYVADDGMTRAVPIVSPEFSMDEEHVPGVTIELVSFNAIAAGLKLTLEAIDLIS